MHSPWGMVDSLMRELGALRHDSRTASVAADREAAAEIDRCIGDVAQVLDDAIAGPEDEQRLLDVCEAIVVARARVEALRHANRKSQELIFQSEELRRDAGRRLYDSLRLRQGGE